MNRSAQAFSKLRDSLNMMNLNSEPSEVRIERSNEKENFATRKSLRSFPDSEDVNANENLENCSAEQIIEILSKHRKTCEASGNYVEAEMAKTRIDELKSQMYLAKANDLRVKHEEEKQIVEREFAREINAFNVHWDSNMEEFTKQADEIKKNLLQKQNEEFVAFGDELESTTSTKPKESTKLLNLRKTQESLAKQQNYQEAHKVQQECSLLEIQEKEKFLVDRAKRITSQKSQLQVKHDNEYSALSKRISSGQDEQRKARMAEKEKLSHRYQNIRKELEAQQSLELKKFEKSFKTPNFANTNNSTFGKSKTNTLTNIPANTLNGMSKTNVGRRSLK